jgi:AcrR family transcriptional regulator
MSHGWEQRQRRTRAEILHAAGELIAAGGVEALTMRKLADRANVAVATLYNQFDDRSGVIAAFVSNGLDVLEIELDEQPAAAPIDATRLLMLGLDTTISADDSVWRPVLATLKANPTSERMGAVGDRIIASIEADLAKARADGLFIADIDTERVARHLFMQKMRGLERWANAVIDWDTYFESTWLGTELILAAILVEPHRTDALRRAGVVA